MARPREHSVEELRELILDAAGGLLDAEGGAALSARRIAASIGYSAATLYSVFRNLDDLCWHLNARTLEQLHLELSRTAEESPRGRLLAYARNYIDFARAKPERWSLLFEHRSPADTVVPGWLADSIDRLFKRIESELQLLAPGGGEGELRLNARTLWGAVHGIAVLQQRDKLFMPEGVAAERMLVTLVEHYLDGWLAGQRGER